MTKIETEKHTKRELPNGWRWVKLKKIGFFEAGGTPAKQCADYWNGDIPFVTGADITELYIYKTNARAFLTRDGLYSGKTAICEVGTVLIVTRTRVGRVGIAQEKMGASQDITAFKCGSEIHQEFLCRYFNNISEHLIDNCRGATIQGLTRGFVDNLEIPLPPLPEQRRIASILKEQMATVEKARTAAQARLEAVKALPAAYLRRVFPKAGEALPEGWRWVKLGDIIRLKSGEFLPAYSMIDGGAFPVYGGNGVTGWHDNFMFEEPKIIIGRVGALCGCVHFTKPKSWITDNALYVSNKITNFDDNFLLHYLTFLNLNKLANQMGQPVITSKAIYEQVIAFPILIEQNCISGLIKEQMATIDNLRAATEAELNTISAMPAAMLRRAFNGEL